MFRAIYSSASASVRVQLPNGQRLLSESFPVRRGVVQGDIFSPWCFILAVEFLFRKCGSEGGTSALGVWLSKLEYADDAALIDVCTETATARVNTLFETSIAEADMYISKPKTEVMRVKKLDTVVCDSDFSKVPWSHVCEHCGRGFDSKDGLSTHQSLHCRLAAYEECEIEFIRDARGHAENRFYLVRWKGWDESHDQWLNWRQCMDAMEAVDEFWDNSSYDRQETIWLDAESGKRCEKCCQLFKTQAALKTHHTKKQCPWADVKRTGRAVRAARRFKAAAELDSLGHVVIGDTDLKNVYNFKYLGGGFTADGDPEYPIELRMDLAAGVYRRLARMWTSKTLSRSLKIRIYKAAVISTLVHGYEGWQLTPRVVGLLDSWNARRMAHITGREIRSEHSVPTFHLSMWLRALRLQWAGHLLRDYDSSNLAAVVAKQDSSRYGLFMDVGYLSLDERLELAHDRDLWRGLVEKLFPLKARSIKRSKGAGFKGVKAQDSELKIQ